MASNKELELEIHPLDQHQFIGTIKIEMDKISSEIQTVIILDKSGSMGTQTRRFTNTIIPLVMSKLSYEKSHTASLIAFSNSSQLYCRTAEGFKSLAVDSEGGTYVAPAVTETHKLFQSFDANKPIRVLTISDGEITDKAETEDAVKALVKYLQASHFSINSQAVRLFTSSNQPDTNALCSLLQINNTTKSQLADISANESDETIATKVAQLFLCDNFSNSKSLTMQEQIILKFPWDPQPTSQYMLLPGGMNVFWLKKIPTNVMIGHRPVKVITKEQVTLQKFQQLMEGKLVYILDHMKILKVLGTDEANKSVNVILKYFETKEDELAKKSTNGEKQISALLGEIARDENFKNLNPEKMAEYLREISKKQEEAANRRRKEAEEMRKKEEIRKKEEEESIKKQELVEIRIKEEAERKKQEEESIKKKELEEIRIKEEAERKNQEEEEIRKTAELEEIRKKEALEEVRKMQELEEVRRTQELEELKKKQELVELRKREDAVAQQLKNVGHLFFKIIRLILKSKFNFFFIIFLVVLAIIEFKLQSKSDTENCEV